jgi:hypothetical protein
MATVTRKFRDDFDIWAADRLAKGEFTPADMDEFKDLLRRDLTPGPDQLRAGLTIIIAAGVEVPASRCRQPSMITKNATNIGLITLLSRQKPFDNSPTPRGPDESISTNQNAYRRCRQ